ncbi:g4588 [Coccomyxa elongata]
MQIRFEAHRKFLEQRGASTRRSHRCKASSYAGSQKTSTERTEVDNLVRWLIEQKGLPPQRTDCVGINADGTWSFFTNTDVREGEALVELPGDISVTAVDVAAHEEVSGLAEGRGELTGLALWLMAERQKGAASQWAPFLECLPDATDSPVLWPEQQQAELLQKSPTLKECRQRRAALQQEWENIAQQITSSDGRRFSEEVYNREAFERAMSVVLAHAAYLPSAACFALLPLAAQAPRTGDESGALLDYDLQRERVIICATCPYRRGEPIAIYDGRPNGELLLATGRVEDDNASDCLTITVGLVQSDRLFTVKKQIVESVGFGIVQEFPIFRDRMPTQLLAYLRLARLTDPALLAKVSFEEDVILNQLNEYEVLQLLLGECRDRLTSYAGSAEEDLKLLQQAGLSERERLAARLRMAEKRILQGTLDAVRRRLAPIRGIPTKGGGLTDPNADLKEVFDVIETLPSLPGKVVGGFMSWARGEQDPDWKKKKPPR